MKVIERIAKGLKSLTNEWIEVSDDMIDFMRLPLVIDVCHVTGTIYLHDFGFGDGAGDIKDYYVGKYPAALLKRVPMAIADVKRRMEEEKK